MPARYLIRIDDICPTMNWSVWSRVEKILADAGVRPLLAVVPDNQDTLLKVDPPAADFWDRARAWQAQGWSIGLHGYRHLYATQDSGLIGRNSYSEFAGVPREEQRAKLRAGIEIFRSHGLTADAWIAPGHSFDATTVDLLPEIGIDTVSDGYALWPFREGDMVWVPLQLGRFFDLPVGDWTVCLHINDWTDADVAKFGAEIAAYRPRITSLNELRATAHSRRRGLVDRIFGLAMRTARALRG